MKIAGIQYNSTVDYPGQVVDVIFLQGCNLECWYCHNKALIDEDKPGVSGLYEQLWYLVRSDSILSNGIMFSGGEPTLQYEEIVKFLKACKTKKLVGIETNGTQLYGLKKLIPYVNFVAIDIKAKPTDYHMIGGKLNDIRSIFFGIEYMLEKKTNFQVRVSLKDNTEEKTNEIIEAWKFTKPIKNIKIQQLL